MGTKRVPRSSKYQQLGRNVTPDPLSTTPIDHTAMEQKENLCLYGFPSEQWEVNLPAEEVPPELPEPALGINNARDGMQEKDWLSFVAVHSDAWLLSVSFYFGARFGFEKSDRKRLFNMINDLPTVFEVVNGTAQTNQKEKSTPPPPPPTEEEEGLDDEEEDDDEHGETLCGPCGENYASDEFWISCNICEKWFPGKCVNITPGRAEKMKQYKLIINTYEERKNLISCPLYDVLFDKSVSNAIHLENPLQRTPSRDIRIVGSCNGLMCIIEEFKDTVFIYNPTTRRSNLLPCSQRIGWSLFTNGTLHWATGDDSSPHSWKIVSLDLANETYGEVLQPEYPKGDGYLDLGVAGEWLCVLHDYCQSPVMDVWVMKVYGVKDSWTKLASIPYHDHSWGLIWYPLCISKDAKLLLQFGLQLLIYDSKDSSSSVIENKYYDACIVVESLVSPFPPLGLADNNGDED
ncbi:PHD finger protein ALFIN-LIKE 4-like protein [Tanacetum coccineum]